MGITHQKGLGTIVYKTAHTPKQGAFRMGRYHYPRHVLHVHEHPRAGYQNGVLCRFWGLVVGAPKERREPAGQRCAYARRCPAGVAAPLGCVIFSVSVKIATSTLCVQGFPHVRKRGWYHYPQRALRAVETPDGRLPKGLICRFLRLPSSTPCAVTFSANTQISLSAISVANTFALWYDKS